MSDLRQPISEPGGPIDLPAVSILSRLAPPTVYHRVAWIGLPIILELVAASNYLHADSHSRAGVVTLLHRFAPQATQAAIAFVGFFLVFGYLRAKPILAEVGSGPASVPVRQAPFAGHCCALALCGVLFRFGFGGGFGAWTGPAGLVCLLSGLLAIVLAGVAFFPLETWARLVRGTGNAWAYAGAAAVFVCWLGDKVRLLWRPAVQATFFIVKFLLGLFLSRVISDPATATIGSSAFRVDIQPACSGLEGIGLMLVFGIVWLWLFRQDLRFPQALLLVPVSLGVAFLFNSVRIAALILIGNAGGAAIALGGFHSQAGWIGFNAVALGLVVGSQHVPWIARRRPQPAAAGSRGDNPSALYLAPFVAILAAGMLSRAFAGQFEWLYPLRLCAVAAVVWGYRKQYAKLDWTFDWLGPAAGVVVFALWLALDRLVVSGSSSGTVPGMAPGHGAAWIAWLALRTLGAVAAVPIAEELAFRGFLLRRLVAADFERVDFRNTSLVALLGSSVGFGLMHGPRWLAGSLAGLAYALVARRRGRIGEAIAAHAATNALLAAWVIARGDWRLW